jgi:hypothetical protein
MPEISGERPDPEKGRSTPTDGGGCNLDEGNHYPPDSGVVWECRICHEILRRVREWLAATLEMWCPGFSGLRVRIPCPPLSAGGRLRKDPGLMLLGVSTPAFSY